MTMLLLLFLILIVAVFSLISRLRLHFQREMRRNYNKIETISLVFFVIVMVIAIVFYIIQQLAKQR